MDEPRSATTETHVQPLNLGQRGELGAPSTLNRVNISGKQEQREPDISSREETGGN